jgi:hypothetical protein
MLIKSVNSIVRLVFYFWIIIVCCIFVCHDNNPSSFPSFIAGDTEPQLLIKLYSRLPIIRGLSGLKENYLENLL